ncbi:MAG: bifunctional (p)ppGpp synthetase/guanosine-3',5'-bis(diphosphate) 3'-pyrophosphohydrolase [Clostridia bacterium]|nr:bifunctional (p)ppGpp synthetase/guanosine-3',5'-bis(diphosphate) 3'-pyrophosphohydrolase [Clostridia bacterium]
MNNYTLSPQENEPFKKVDNQFEGLINQIESILQRDDTTATLNIEILKKAWDVAKFYHKNALRISGDLYLIHPLAVCQKLCYDGFLDTNVLVASLLHDTVEDKTGYTFKKMEEDFNKTVCAYVRAVTRIEATDDPLDLSTRRYSSQLTDERLLNATEKHKAALYIKFADRLHNLRTCQKMDQDRIEKNVAHTKSVLIPLARRMGCNSIADELIDACMMAQSPRHHANISEQLSAFVQNSRKTLNKTFGAIKVCCKDKAVLEGADGKIETPPPVFVAKQIKSLGTQVNLNRPDLFSFYGYRPYAVLYLKILNPTRESLFTQFIKICQPLIDEGIISVDGEGKADRIRTTEVVYMDVVDNYNNRVRVWISTEDFRNTLTKQPDIKLSLMALLPPERKIQVFTRDGRAMEIEKGSTVLDFAFMLNQEIGASFLGAEVNGIRVEIDHVLEQDDHVKILRADYCTARLDWFPILETKTARNRLVEVFKQQMEAKKDNADIKEKSEK